MGRIRTATLLGVLLAFFSVSATAQAQEGSPLAVKRQLNDNTVRLLTGDLHATSTRMADDLAAVLDDGLNLQVVPVTGRGTLQGVTDLLYLRGIDLAVLQADVLAYARDNGLHKGLDRRLQYVTRLHEEELHILAPRAIGSLRELAGRRVNFGLPGGGGTVTAANVFNALGISVSPLYYDLAQALEFLKAGHIDAVVHVAGKPDPLLGALPESAGLHVLEVPAIDQPVPRYQEAYLTSEDYPGLIAPGERRRTVAVEMLLAVFNWKPDTARYATVERFANAFFDHFSELREAPWHRKWQEVDLRAALPGWTRFPPAEDRVGGVVAVTPLAEPETYSEDELRQAFEGLMEEELPGLIDRLDAGERDRLFQRYLTALRSSTE